MKKLGLVLGIIIVVLIAGMMIIPMVYKDELVGKTKKMLNESLDTKVEFADLEFSFFKSFPNIRLSVTDLIINGAKEYKNDTLFYAKALSTDIGLGKLISGEIDINSLRLSEPTIKLMASQTGSGNWELGSPSAEKEPEKPKKGESDGFSIGLEELLIEDATLLYIDEASKMRVALDDLLINISGEVQQGVSDLKVNLSEGHLKVVMDTTQFIEQWPLQLQLPVVYDGNTSKVKIAESMLSVNGYETVLQGDVDMATDSMQLDLNLKSKNTDLTSLLKLVPDNFKELVGDLNVSGSHSLNADVKGYYAGEDFPVIDVALVSKGGELKHKELPDAIKKLDINVKVVKAQGPLDGLALKVEPFAGYIGNEPFTTTMELTNLMGDPQYDFSLDGNVDLAYVAKLSGSDLDLAGKVVGQINSKGDLYAAMENDFNKFTTDGEVKLSDFVMKDEKMKEDFQLNNAIMKFSSKKVAIQNMQGQFGKTDFAMTGHVENYFPYIFDNKKLRGNFHLQSDMINVNQLMAIANDMTPADTTTVNTAEGQVEEQEATSAVRIPENLQFTITSDVNQVLYDQLTINDIKGQMDIDNGIIDLKNLGMKMLNGAMNMNGKYISSQKNPSFDFNVKVDDFDIQKAYHSLSVLRKMIPIAGKSVGRFSTNLDLNGVVSPNNKIIVNTMNGLGDFSSKGLQIVDSGTFDQISSLLKKDKLKNIVVDDFITKFNIENGGLRVSPFKTKIADQEMTISGFKGADDKLDFTLDVMLDRNMVKDDLNNLFGIIPGSENIKYVDASLLIGGTVTKPEVKLDLSRARRQIKEELKKKTADDWKDAAKKLGKGLEKLFK
ncbi:AsmA family protein [Puteibacter caeruleilacunae]|nr:AsmA family protein [Puteibacter caeruleilacunae]